MIYECRLCNFIFERRADTILCPVCGKYSVSEASEESKAKFLALQEEEKHKHEKIEMKEQQ